MLTEIKALEQRFKNNSETTAILLDLKKQLMLELNKIEMAKRHATELENTIAAMLQQTEEKHGMQYNHNDYTQSPATDEYAVALLKTRILAINEIGNHNLPDKAIIDAIESYVACAISLTVDATKGLVRESLQGSIKSKNPESAQLILGPFEQAILNVLEHSFDFIFVDNYPPEGLTADQKTALDLSRTSNTKQAPESVMLTLASTGVVTNAVQKIVDLATENLQISVELQNLRDSCNEFMLENITTDEFYEIFDAFCNRKSIIFDEMKDSEPHKINLVMEQIIAALCDVTHSEKEYHQEFVKIVLSDDEDDAQRESKSIILSDWINNVEFTSSESETRKQLLKHLNDQLNDEPDTDWQIAICMALIVQARQHLKETLDQQAQVKQKANDALAKSTFPALQYSIAKKPHLSTSIKSDKVAIHTVNYQTP